MKKEFNIHVKMEERYVNYFLSFLKYMEFMGKIGHSGLVSFFSDGDGDFRPSFSFDIDYDGVVGINKKKLIELHKEDYRQVKVSEFIIPEITFDAG